MHFNLDKVGNIVIDENKIRNFKSAGGRRIYEATK
jgi:hypothetical protein